LSELEIINRSPVILSSAVLLVQRSPTTGPAEMVVFDGDVLVLSPREV
jgi:hypothetical protein